MLGRRTAAAADDVDEARIGEFAEMARHVFRALVVMAKLVRQTGVRIGADERVADPCQFGDMGAHLRPAERAVQSDRNWSCVLYLAFQNASGRLARQQSPGAIGEVVPEIITGTSTPRCSHLLGNGVIAALALSVSVLVSISKRSLPAPPVRAPAHRKPRATGRT